MANVILMSIDTQVNTYKKAIGYFQQEETRKIVFRGERGPWPPIFVANNSTDEKRGAKIFNPPNI